MLIKHRFSVNGVLVTPSYTDELNLEYNKETNQEFFRKSLSGTLKFLGIDFDFLDAQPFETAFNLKLEKSTNLGLSWVSIYEGVFYKTNGKWDRDTRKVEIQVDTKDNYTEVLAGVDDEYDLIKLAPAKVSLTYNKRALFQTYIEGDNKLSNFFQNDSWETDLAIDPPAYLDLINNYHFSSPLYLHKILLTGSGTPDLVGEFVISYGTADFTATGSYSFLDKTHLYRMTYSRAIEDTGGEFQPVRRLKIIRISDDLLLFEAVAIGENETDIEPSKDIIMTAVNGAGSFTAYWTVLKVYGRVLTNVENSRPSVPTSDIVENAYSFKYVSPFAPTQMYLSNEVQEDSTEYGVSDEGLYFIKPSTGVPTFPTAKSLWGYSAIWVRPPSFSGSLWDSPHTMKDATLISDVLKVLLKEADETITHEGTAEYSEFLYGETNPLTPDTFRLLVTSKSNIIVGEYDQPAKTAKTTLNTVLTCLRAMKLFWFIDEQKRFRIEHIQWFRNGGSYSTTPETNFDLENLYNTRNSLSWAYGLNKYEFEKEELPESYSFEWGDTVSAGFEGEDITVESKFVQRGKTEDITVSGFTPDIDYLQLNPTEVSKEGFALIAATLVGETYKPIYWGYSLSPTFTYVLQNGLLSWYYIAQYLYPYDMPSYNTRINGGGITIQGVQKRKKQTIKFAYEGEIDPMKLIKTPLGNGQINKLIVHLSSLHHEINLAYDTQ